MVDWYQTAHNALVEARVKKSDLKKIVETSRALLRYCLFKKFLETNHIAIVFWN